MALKEFQVCWCVDALALHELCGVALQIIWVELRIIPAGVEKLKALNTLSIDKHLLPEHLKEVCLMVVCCLSLTMCWSG